MPPFLGEARKGGRLAGRDPPSANKLSMPLASNAALGLQAKSASNPIRSSASSYQKSITLSPATEAGSCPGRRVTFLARTRNVTQRMRPDCLRPCAALRANLRHAIQSAVPPNSLRAFSAPLKQTAASQSTMQRCPVAALPAAQTACRRRRHTGACGYGWPA